MNDPLVKVVLWKMCMNLFAGQKTPILYVVLALNGNSEPGKSPYEGLCYAYST